MANLLQIQKFLEQKQLDFEVIDLKKEAFTVDDVVDAGVKLDEVVKTLVVWVNDGAYVALALRGSDRLDFKKVRKLFGSKTELAKPEEVLRVVGVPVGAVCPILIGIPVYFDKNVLKLKYVHMGSGDLEHGLEMKFGHLLKAIGIYKAFDMVI